MRRWTLLLAGAALWLFLAAIPALADGGPHVAAINDGTSGLTADSCAGCHRAHTAQAEFQLITDEATLCLACHGTMGNGASTNVEDGVQYASLNNGTYGGNTGPIIGALRGGGFVNARIGSAQAYRSATGNRKVPVLATGSKTTSAHLKLAGATFATQPGIAWGNGADSATPNPGPVVSLSCGSCHNPHGNGNYRILRPQPDPEPGLATPLATAVVPDGPTLAKDLAGATRNYTVIQTDGLGAPIYLASDVVAVGNAVAGDYWHQRVPWTSSVRGDYDNPIGNADKTVFKTQITAWCSTCHTRYFQSGFGNKTTDAIYVYRHDTTSSRPCTTCHVAHGSNAAMTGTYSTHVALPNNIVGGKFNPVSTTVSTDSLLLKVDNRGTCQMCHDPTESGEPAAGPTPAPLLP